MRCPSGKIRYRHLVAAQLALATVQREDDTARPKTETRAYRCPLCRGFHLTSRPQRRRRGRDT